MPNEYASYEAAIRNEDAAKVASQVAREKLTEAKALVVERERDVTLAEIDERGASDELASARTALQQARKGSDNRPKNEHKPKGRTPRKAGIKLTRAFVETLNAMPDTPTPRKQLAADLGVDLRTLDQRIGRMKREGLVEPSSDGVYTLTELGREVRAPRLRAITR